MDLLQFKKRAILAHRIALLLYKCKLINITKTK